MLLSAQSRLGPYGILELLGAGGMGEVYRARDTRLGRDVAIKIADALETAHDRGITHRDLKPGNIKVTPEGTVKVLDFGLASIAQAADGDYPDPANSPTVTLAATLTGAIVGTAGYMSPEQAKGKRVDRRADVWAFGVVLYEMLSGSRAFMGETASEILAAVIMAEPDFEKLPAATSP